ncbi:MAG: hypothetical protein JWP29_3620 [Rhodoferax sp.]|nr:hypothetical protein [Rhodoferax sp.]
MNTSSASLVFDDPESERLEHIESWQAIGIVALGTGGLALVLAGLGALAVAVAHTLGRLFG